MKRFLFLILVAAAVTVSGCVSEEPQSKSFSDGTLNFTYLLHGRPLILPGHRGPLQGSRGFQRM